jgi:hypothetical protein
MEPNMIKTKPSFNFDYKKKKTRTKGFINPMNWFQDQIISTTKKF